LKKIVFFVRDWGVMTQRRGAILGTKSKKVGIHCVKYIYVAKR